MLLGCIADDFTGASDLANILVRAGMSVTLLIGVPEAGVSIDADAAVIALKSRSIVPAEAVRQSLDALRWLEGQGCDQFFFKYCSTFDSTPQGNIGPVAEALAEALGAYGSIVCPAFPQNGRTLYQGHLFVGDRLLSESGMERHPLTPMTDPDIRRWLARQSRMAPGHVGLADVRRGAARMRELLDHAAERLVVVDAISDEDLLIIGEAAAGKRLVTGGSAVAQGLPANFRRSGKLGAARSAFAPLTGDALIVAGSCSRATREQVELYEAIAPAYRLSVERLVAGEPVEAEILAFIDAERGRAPLVYSSDRPEAVARIQAEHGGGKAAEAVEQLFGRIARAAVGRGFERIVVAGGETSGAVVGALALRELAVGTEIDPGVPALSGRSEGQAVALALKSGNFGVPEFFAKALDALGGASA
jgi:uncharacterized protein YgbK (DUF1537 family)